MKQLFALITTLALLLCGTAFADTPEYLNLDSTMPIVEDGNKITLKIAALQGDTWTAKPEDHYLWAFIEKYCNIDLDVTYYKTGSWDEQKSLLFLSDTLPDIIFGANFSPADLVKYGQFEGVLYPMEDLIREYAPLISDYADEHPEMLANSTTPDGHVYALPRVDRDNVDVNTVRAFIHESWLKEQGVEMPKTLDELTDILKAFRDGDPNGNGDADEIPFLAKPDSGRVIVLTAMGINASDPVSFYATEDGKVTIGAMSENYVHYLEYMKMLFEEGLIDEDFYTMTDDEYNAKLSQNVAGLAVMSAPFVYMPEAEKYEQYQHIIPLTSAYNDTPVWPGITGIQTGVFAICRDTKYPEVCIRLANLFFEENINLLAFAGPQASENLEPQYPVEGWEPVYAKLVDGAIVFETSTGEDLGTYIFNHVGNMNQVGPAYMQDEANALVGYDAPLGPQEMHWRNSMRENAVPYERLKLPTLFLDEASIDRANELRTPIEDYINTMEAKFIMGTTPLEEIDTFYATLEGLHIDEYISLYQTAYDSYLVNEQ